MRKHLAVATRIRMSKAAARAAETGIQKSHVSRIGIQFNRTGEARVRRGELGSHAAELFAQPLVRFRLISVDERGCWHAFFAFEL